MSDLLLVAFVILSLLIGTLSKVLGVLEEALKVSTAIASDLRQLRNDQAKQSCENP